MARATRAAPSQLPVMAMGAAVLMWGIFWLPLRWLDAAGLHGAWVIVGINSVAIVAMLPLLAFCWRSRPRLDGRLVILGLALGGSFACYFTSLLLIPIVKALVLFYMTPLWGTLFGIFMLGERLRLARCVAMLSCAAGLVVVLGGGAAHLPVPETAGDWLALAGGIIWSYGTTLLVLQDDVPALYQCVAMFVGGLAISVVAILLLPAAVAGAAPDLAALGSFLPVLLGLTLILFIPSNLLATWGARMLSPGFVGLLMPAEIIVGIVSVAALSGDPIAPRQVVGAALIIAGSLIDGLGEVLMRRRAAPS